MYRNTYLGGFDPPEAPLRDRKCDSARRGGRAGTLSQEKRMLHNLLVASGDKPVVGHSWGFPPRQTLTASPQLGTSPG